MGYHYQPIKRQYFTEDGFFKDGNCEYQCGYVDDDMDFIIDSMNAIHIEEFQCSVKGCNEKFENPLHYNRHFDIMHKFRCEDCSKNFPSNYLLGLHIDETHDSFFKTRLENGESVYRCLLQTCDKTFNNEGVRKSHLISSHKYPADFRFNVIKRQHKKYQEKKKEKQKANLPNQSKQKSVKNIETMDVSVKDNTLNTIVMDTADNAIDKVNGNSNTEKENSRVPQSFSFGRGVSRGLSRRGKSR